MPVRIPLGEGFFLTSDESNWMLVEEKVFETGKRAGEAYDSTVGFFPRLGGALDACLDLRLRRSNETSLQGLKTLLEGFRREIKDALTVEAWNAE